MARLGGANRLFRGAHHLLHGTHHLFRGAGHLLRATADRSTERLARSAERIARSRERMAQIPAPNFAPRRLYSGAGLAQVTKKRGRSDPRSTRLAVRRGRGRGRQRRGAGGKRAAAGQNFSPALKSRPDSCHSRLSGRRLPWSGCVTAPSGGAARFEKYVRVRPRRAVRVLFFDRRRTGQGRTPASSSRPSSLTARQRRGGCRAPS